MGKKRSRRTSENESSARDSDISDEAHVARTRETELRDLENEEKEFQQVPAYGMSESQFVLAILCLSVGIYVMISSSAPVPAYNASDTYGTKKNSASTPNPLATQQRRDVQNSSQSGGWRAADGAATLTQYHSDICNIIRKPSSKINSKKFDREYRHMKPVIIQFPDGAGSWIQPEMWSLSQLLQKYGIAKVKYGSSIDLAYGNDKAESDLSLADFIHQWMPSNTNHSLMASVNLPEQIANGTFKPPKFLNTTAGFSDGSFNVGPSGSGVAFRRMTDVWSGVVYGQQRWFLYAPETTPSTGYGPGVEVTHWVDSFYRRGAAPMECVLNPGDILYVPGWWYSSFLNLGDTLAIQFLNHASQDSIIGNLSSRLDAIISDTSLEERTRLEQSFSTLLELHEMFPSNTEFINRLGENYAARGDFASGIATTLEAVTLDADFLVAHLNLGKMYFATGQYAEAEKHFQKAAEVNPTNAELCGLFGEYLVYRKRVQEGIRWFQTGASHHPHRKEYFMTLANQAREILNPDADLTEASAVPLGLRKTSAV